MNTCHKILITRFPYESQLSGEEWHTIELAERLRKKGHEVFFMGSDHILLSELEKRGFKVRKIWGGRPPVTLKQVFIFTLLSPFIFINLGLALISFKLSHNISILYSLSLTEKLLLTPLARLLRMKVIWMEHARIGRWLLKNPFFNTYKLWSSFAQVVFVSKQSEAFMPWIKNKHVIINGIDLKEFHTKKYPSRHFLSHLKIEKDEKLVGVIARLYKDKGLDYFIKAAPQVLAVYPNTKFFIVGKGPEREALRELIKNMGLERKCHMLGELERKEVVDFLNIIDVFILPSSLHDPFGLVGAEAMSCGKPLIVTGVCGIVDELSHLKDSIIIPEKNETAIANAMIYLFSNPDKMKELSKNALITSKEKFSIEEMVEKYEKLF